MFDEDRGTDEQRITSLEERVAELSAQVAQTRDAAATGFRDVSEALMSLLAMVMKGEEQLLIVTEASGRSFALVDSIVEEIQGSVRFLSRQMLKMQLGISDEDIDTMLGDTVAITPESYEDVRAASAIPPRTITNASGQMVTLTFPEGDADIINEQGLFGFFFKVFETDSSGERLEYLDDLAVALFDQGLITDEGSDHFLNITSAWRLGGFPEIKDIAAICKANAITEEYVEIMRHWAAGNGGAFVASAEGADVNGVLLGLLWTAFVLFTAEEAEARLTAHFEKMFETVFKA